MPNPFWGGVAVPGRRLRRALRAGRAVERRSRATAPATTCSTARATIRWRTAFGAAFFTWVATIFFAGAADRLFVRVGIDYSAQVRVYRALVFVLPVAGFIIAKRLCDDLRRSEVPRPARPAPRGSRAGSESAD